MDFAWASRERVAWRRPVSVAVAWLLLCGAGCVPIPAPIRVSEDEEPVVQPAPLKYPVTTELLTCLADALQEERADIQIGDASRVWAEIESFPDERLTLNELLNDAGARAQLVEQQVDYVITVQLEVKDLGKQEAGSVDWIYGAPTGPYAGFERVDYHLLAVIRATERDSRQQAGTTAHERSGIFGGPFLPAPWFVVMPVGDPEIRACEALAEEIAEKIPASASGSSFGVILFEADWIASESTDSEPGVYLPDIEGMTPPSPEIRGEPMPRAARVVLADVLRTAFEPRATVTQVEVERFRCTFQVDSDSIKNLRRFEEALSANPKVLRWTGPPDSVTYRIKVAAASPV